MRESRSLDERIGFPPNGEILDGRSMTWVTCAAAVAVVAGLTTTEYLDVCGSCISLEILYWITWVTKAA